MTNVLERRGIAGLSGFQVTRVRGFLPATDPLLRLPHEYDAWEQIAADLPRLLAAGRVRPAIDGMPLLDPAYLDESAQLERAMLLLSYFGHAYVWAGSEEPRDSGTAGVAVIPSGLALPWYAVAQRLGRPPILSYASYALHNWRRFDLSGPVALGNLALLQNFLGGLDEDWFVLIHQDIEGKAGPAMAALVDAQHAAEEDDADAGAAALGTVASTLEQMYQTLLRMPEGCDPYIYYHRVRPYIHGWKNHPVLTGGVVYQGVAAYGNRPQQFRGETGAQSSIIPALDAALGISHEDDPLRPYLMEMRDYMPAPHRAFIEWLEQGPSVRDLVLRYRSHSLLRESYNESIHWITEFRSKHLEYAGQYIQRQARGGAANPNDVGTGGTPFMPYLKKHRDESARHKIE